MLPSEWIELLEVKDRHVQAFLPEPDRLQRLSTSFEEIDPLAPWPSGELFGVKDIINVDGLPTHAGSELPGSVFAGPQAKVVSRLRDAGAVVAGKTTTTEFAFSDPSATRNPHSPNHTPGGSSSGSAAAVANGLVPFALGTQTVDSIVTPAAYCGVVGVKPTYGRISLDGIVPFSPSMDHAGLLTANVDIARSVAPIVYDEWQSEPPPPAPVLGIPGSGYLAKADSVAIGEFERVVSSLAAADLTIVQTDALSEVDRITNAHRRLIAAEFSRMHKTWFEEHGTRYRARSAALFEEGAALPGNAIVSGRRSSRETRAELDEMMDREGIAVWISPAATGTAPLGLDYIGDPVMALPWTHAHMPVVAIPTGVSPDGLPLGIQLTGRHGEDEVLLAVASGVVGALA